MARYARSFRSKLAEGRAGNEMIHALFGDGKPPQIEYPEKRIRAPKADDGEPSEHQSQAAVISWWALACAGYGLPRYALAAVPNGGARDHITGALMKAEGVRAGFPDLILAAKRGEYGGLFIEMKKKGNYPEATQKEIIAYLGGAGYACEVCWSADEAMEAIRKYLDNA